MNTTRDSRAVFIETQLKQHLSPTLLEVIDQGWQHVGHAEEGAGHFKVIISSPQFENLTPVACHRLIYDALGSAVGQIIHALQIEIQ